METTFMSYIHQPHSDGIEREVTVEVTCTGTVYDDYGWVEFPNGVIAVDDITLKRIVATEVDGVAVDSWLVDEKFLSRVDRERLLEEAKTTLADHSWGGDE